MGIQIVHNYIYKLCSIFEFEPNVYSKVVKEVEHSQEFIRFASLHDCIVCKALFLVDLL